VRSTVGQPRFWKHEPLVRCHEVTPHGIFGRGFDTETAQVMYLDRLDRLATPAVTFLADVARAHPGQALVILCFDRVPGQTCHRRWFAEWCESRFGIVVAEVEHPVDALPGLDA
jgi:hypothetical protein